MLFKFGSYTAKHYMLAYCCDILTGQCKRLIFDVSFCYTCYWPGCQYKQSLKAQLNVKQVKDL